MSFVARSFRILMPFALLVAFSACRKDQASSPPSLSSQIQKIESTYKGWTVIPDAGVTSLSDAKVAEIMAFLKNVSNRKPGLPVVDHAPAAKVQVDGGSYALVIRAVWDGYPVVGQASVAYNFNAAGTAYVTGVTGISSSGATLVTTVNNYVGSGYAATLTRTWTATVSTIASISPAGAYTIEWGGLVNYSYSYNNMIMKNSEGFFFSTTVGPQGLPVGTDPIEPP